MHTHMYSPLGIISALLLLLTSEDQRSLGKVSRTQLYRSLANSHPTPSPSPSHHTPLSYLHSPPSPSHPHTPQFTPSCTSHPTLHSLPHILTPTLSSISLMSSHVSHTLLPSSHPHTPHSPPPLTPPHSPLSP